MLLHLPSSHRPPKLTYHDAQFNGIWAILLLTHWAMILGWRRLARDYMRRYLTQRGRNTRGPANARSLSPREYVSLKSPLADGLGSATAMVSPVSYRDAPPSARSVSFSPSLSSPRGAPQPSPYSVSQLSPSQPSPFSPSQTSPFSPGRGNLGFPALSPTRPDTIDKPLPPLPAEFKSAGWSRDHP